MIVIYSSFASSGFIGVRGVISPQAGLGVRAGTLVYEGKAHFTDYRLNSFNS